MVSLIGFFSLIAWLSGGALLAYVLAVLGSWYGGLYTHRHLPGPKPSKPILGHLPDVMKYGGLAHVCKIQAQTWTNFMLYLGASNPIFMITDPELIQIIGLQKLRSFPHRGEFYLNPLIFGSYGFEYSNAKESIVLSTSNSWKSVRAALACLVKTEGLQGFIPLLNESSRQFLDFLLDPQRAGKDQEIHQELGKLTLRNILLAAFGVEIDTLRVGYDKGSAVAKKSAKLLHALKVIFSTPMLEFFSTAFVALLPATIQPFIAAVLFQLAAMQAGSREQSMRDARTHILRTALSLVNSTRKSQGSIISYPVSDSYVVGTPVGGSLVHVLANSRNSDTGQPFDDAAIAAQASLFTLAGYDTTANALSFTLYLLAKNPACQDRAAKECQTLQVQKVESLEELQTAMPYTYACLNEALRMYPPGFITQRQAVEEVQVGPYRIPKGTAVGLNIIGMHYNPRYFPEPDVFKPERFLPESKEKDIRPRNSFMPFGIGARNCLGQKFAILQALLFLGQFLPAVKVELEESSKDQPLQLKSVLTLGPKKGIWLKPVRRG